MIKVAVTGAAGRMGKANIEAIQMAEGIELGAAIVEPGSTLLGADAGEVAGVGKLGVAIVGSLADAVADFDVLIDFTAPEVTLKNVEICVHCRRRIGIIYPCRG